MINNLEITISKTNKNFYVHVYNTSNGNNILSITSNDSFFKRYFNLSSINRYYLFGNILKYKCLNYGFFSAKVNITGKYSKSVKYFLDGFCN